MSEIKIIPDARMEDLVINALEWAIEVGKQATEDLIHGMGITSAELEEIGYDKENFPEMHKWADA